MSRHHNPSNSREYEFGYWAGWFDAMDEARRTMPEPRNPDMGESAESVHDPYSDGNLWWEMARKVAHRRRIEVPVAEIGDIAIALKAAYRIRAARTPYDLTDHWYGVADKQVTG